MSNAPTIARIKSLLQQSAVLDGYLGKHAKVIAQPSVDKHAAAFEADNDRFRAFSLRVSFNCHTGQYGSSSCSVDLYVSTEAVAPYFIRAMNIHKKQLFETAARLIREEAMSLRATATAELETIRTMLDGLDALPAHPVPEQGVGT